LTQTTECNDAGSIAALFNGNGNGATKERVRGVVSTVAGGIPEPAAV
jgi:hypothetical protein